MAEEALNTHETPGLMNPGEADALAEKFKALADPARVRIFAYIASNNCRPVCSCKFPEALGLSQPTVSHHLKKLVDAGLLLRAQNGKWATYTVDLEAFGALRAWPADCLC